MKSQNNYIPTGNHAELQAQQAIRHITKWVDERYPSISPLTKSRLIKQCLWEVSQERLDRSQLN
ncbi:MAG TPA: hypothetical protein VEZ55_03035 [Chitinophagaceae bacterium]|jgi:hypothetical protein|nr:hypothetical protein [Chitinophagaceae bacterium]